MLWAATLIVIASTRASAVIASGVTPPVYAYGMSRQTKVLPSLYFANYVTSPAEFPITFRATQPSPPLFDVSSVSQHRLALVDTSALLLIDWRQMPQGYLFNSISHLWDLTVQTVPQSPAFSPDGSRLAFYTTDGFVRVFSISAERGGSRELLRFPTGAAAQINWMPDGKSLVILEKGAPERPDRLIEYPAGGGAGTLLLELSRINSFDTSRIPGDRKLILSTNIVLQGVRISVYDPTSRTFTATRAVGDEPNWNCAMTKFIYRDTQFKLSEYDWSSGSSKTLTSAPELYFDPRYFKCEPAALAANARRLGGGHF